MIPSVALTDRRVDSARPKMVISPTDHDGWASVLSLLPGHLALTVSSQFNHVKHHVCEIRLSSGKPLVVRTLQSDAGSLSGSHVITEAPVTQNDVDDVLDRLTSSSVYAVSDAIRQGFITLPGGHRAGLVGEARTDGNEVIGFKYVTGINIRISRHISGSASRVIRSLINERGEVCPTLILSPPGAGKTTLLRDLVRTISEGVPSLNLSPMHIGVADERGEISGAHQGIDQLNLGPRTDVISHCPKHIAMTMMLRSMGLQLIATDEIGTIDDSLALADVARGGVGLICTAHAHSTDDFASRPSMKPLWEEKVFQRVIVLTHFPKPGTVKRIVTISRGRAHH